MVSGQWIYPNGSCFKGAFDNNKPKGAGKWDFANGNTVEGYYKQLHAADMPVEQNDDIKLSWTTTGDITA